MPNDFEKQVRQKMEELDFVPGEPVWTKIEEQIRKKKDRRRVIFWLPLFLLLTGGVALWWNQGGFNNSNLQEQSTNVSTNINRETVTGTGPFSNKVNNTESPETNKGDEKIAISKPSGGEKFNYNGKLSALRRSNTVANSIVSSPEKTDQPSARNKAVKLSFTTEELRSVLIKEPLANNIENEIKPSAVSDSAINKDPVLNRDSAITATVDSAEKVTTNSKQKQQSKWRIAMTAFAGFSGLADGLTVLNNEKSFDPAFAPANLGSGPVSGVASYTPASIKNGFSFSIGASAVRQLSEKFRLSAGLEYSYMSNRMQVGADSNGYIRSAWSYASSSALNYYTNHYHFISLPADIAFTPLKKLPLDISAGIALQQLVATDGLVFDRHYGAYTNDKESFTKTQIFTRFGLNYSVKVNQHKLLLGPQLNYGLTNLLDNGTDTHLFSFGLRTAFIF